MVNRFKTGQKRVNFCQKRFKILGVNFSSSSAAELLRKIDCWLTTRTRGQLMIVTPNPEFVVEAQKNPIFRETINKAQISLPDGIGIVWAKKLMTSDRWSALSFGRKVLRGLKYGFWALRGVLAKERISGVDLMTELCRLARRRNWRVFFLGAAPGVAAKTGEVLLGPRKRTIANSLVLGQNWAAFAGDGSSRGDQETTAAIKEAARQLGGTIEILLVAYGMGKQEAWINRNLPHLPIRLAMGVGGAFDYLAGVVPRAPALIRQMGLEWAYRLWHQPWRWRRQLNLLRFLKLVMTYSETKI